MRYEVLDRSFINGALYEKSSIVELDPATVTEQDKHLKKIETKAQSKAPAVPPSTK